MSTTNMSHEEWEAGAEDRANAQLYDCQRENADLKAKLSQVEAVWTNSPPTVPGWYWKRGNFTGQVLIVDVQPHHKDKELGWWEGSEFCADFYDYKWSGPIPDPQEPPSGPTPK